MFCKLERWVVTLTYLEVLERPHAFPVFENVHPLLDSLLETVEKLSVGDPLPEPFAADVKWKVKNYGKTPAILESMALTTFFADEPPPQGSPLYLNSYQLPKEIVLGMGTATDILHSGPHMIPVCKVHPLTEEVCNSIRHGAVFFWCCGVIQYRDVFGWRHRTFFMWRYHFTASVFEPHPTERNRTESECLSRVNRRGTLARWLSRFGWKTVW